MSLLAIEWAPPKRQLRHFGWLLALVLAASALFLRPTVAALVLEVLAAVAFVLGTLWPKTLHGAYVVLMVLTAPLGWLMGHFLLTLVYYLVLTPLGLALRLMGRDALCLRCNPAVDSYWQPRSPVSNRRRYFRQY